MMYQKSQKSSTIERCFAICGMGWSEVESRFPATESCPPPGKSGNHRPVQLFANRCAETVSATSPDSGS